ncbi:MAG: hypothetical protein ACYDDF_08445 [Thermoplasmatota archaeon]
MERYAAAEPRAIPARAAATGNGLIYQTFAGEERIVAFSQESGASAWQRIVPKQVLSPATLLAGYVFYAYGGNVSMVDAFTEEQVGIIHPRGLIDGGSMPAGASMWAPSEVGSRRRAGSWIASCPGEIESGEVGGGPRLVAPARHKV